MKLLPAILGPRTRAKAADIFNTYCPPAIFVAGMVALGWAFWRAATDHTPYRHFDNSETLALDIPEGRDYARCSTMQPACYQCTDPQGCTAPFIHRDGTITWDMDFLPGTILCRKDTLPSMLGPKWVPTED